MLILDKSTTVHILQHGEDVGGNAHGGEINRTGCENGWMGS